MVAAGKKLHPALRSLRHRNFQLFFAGQLISLTGTWMQSVAQSWLVYRLTDSGLLLGLVSFAGQFPVLLLAPVGGSVADEFSRHRIVLATQAASMLLALTLAFLTLSGQVQIWHVFVLAALMGLVNAFDIPARQAFLVEMVGRGDLMNAIALNSSMFNAARLLGPTVAGAIIAASSEGWCYLIDGVSFLAVIAALLAMRMQLAPVKTGTAVSPIEQFKEGWDYAYNHRAIRSIITLIALVCLLGFPYVVLMPIFAATVLHGGPHTLGFLMTASGCGALLGALYLAGRRSTAGLGPLIPGAGALFGLGLMAFAFSHVLWLSIVLMVITGFGSMVQVASSNTLLQTIVEDGKRGRVMSFFLMAYFGTMPFGSLIAGSVSDRYGAPITLAFGGACCVAGAIWFATTLSSIEHQIAPAYARVDG
jgi:MFS family permease